MRKVMGPAVGCDLENEYMHLWARVLLYLIRKICIHNDLHKGERECVLGAHVLLCIY